MYEKLKIGAMVYCVHHKYVTGEASGGIIKVCRVKTFHNVEGMIMPILTLVGNSKLEVSTRTHQAYVALPEAINAIR